ncbi:Nfu1p [Cyberlindnera jadinii NRRL Y-1542]|uniref:HIRA-interacting protein 5 n=1 Tax=Cyberlindnera jadinii (strain ATCC 18201 / CBS 1600 / BCRC 20928 / JCM 3617 / NBRC 0987 / NRRL Y-1542) TaxID=983966 RepID=A0A1E4S4C9_CYBJN|nr:HIRA-interacting protein 5 [Cyberlindnera jadinii NRRL Y-1542]ODV74303.1 HIRA-interacting protein 5 [Cyberlindnera jadinii NRRL Y-1542]
MFPTLRTIKAPITQTNRLNFARLLSIKALTTPNENALKFQVDRQILDDPNSSYQINVLNQAQSPLAAKIFEYSSDVDNVLIGSNFITVNKNEFAHWNQVKPVVESILESHLTKKEPIIDLKQVERFQTGALPEDARGFLTEEEQEISEEVAELIETRIRPAIQEDGGDIVFLRYHDGKVYVQLQGACTSCSLSDDTLKAGIQSMLSHYVEEVEEVINLAEVEFNKFEERLKAQRENRH